MRPVSRCRAVAKREPTPPGPPARDRCGSGCSGSPASPEGAGSSRERSPDGERVACPRSSARRAPVAPATRSRRTQAASSGSSRVISAVRPPCSRETQARRTPGSSASQIWRWRAAGRSGGAPSRGAPTTQISSHSGRSSSRVRQAASCGPVASRGVRADTRRRTPSAVAAGESVASGSWSTPQAKRTPAASARRERTRKAAICATRGPPSWPGPASNTARHAPPVAGAGRGASSEEMASSNGTSAGAASGGSASRYGAQTDCVPADSIAINSPSALSGKTAPHPRTRK